MLEGFEERSERARESMMVRTERKEKRGKDVKGLNVRGESTKDRKAMGERWEEAGMLGRDG